MNEFSPDLNEFYKIEEASLTAKLEAIRAVMSHAGEKGRALEAEVSKLLRSILPSEYGLSTGFIAFEKEAGCFELSSQLDIIIYDAIRSGPLARFETCDVFPLEAVYGYVEVKASLCTSKKEEPPPNSLEHCIKQCAKLRQMRKRKYYGPKPGTVTEALLAAPQNAVAIRSWVFAFEATGSINEAEPLAQRFADVSARLDPQPHLHGLFVAGLGYFRTVPIEDKGGHRRTYYDIAFTTTHPMTVFKWELLHGLARYPRLPPGWTANVARYSPFPAYEVICSDPIIE
jgi:hypothetical protein